MTQDERAVWSSLCLTITGLSLALSALRREDLRTCDEILLTVGESGKMFVDALQETMISSEAASKPEGA